MANETAVVVKTSHGTATVIGADKWTPERLQAVLAKYAHKINFEGGDKNAA